MYSKPLALKLIKVAVYATVMYLSLLIGFAWGVEEKTWFQMSWDLIAGGAIGALTGFLFFITFGAIGWVCGALYGALGVVSLVFGGAIGGLGLGSFVNFLRAPDSYNVDWPILIGTLLVGVIVAKVLSSIVARAASKLISPTPLDPQRPR